MDDLLKLLGLDYEELNHMERATLESWQKDLESHTLSPDDVREKITQLKNQMEEHLTEPGLPHDTDLFLKAQLKCFRLLEGFLSGPEQARKALINYLKKQKR